jgi:pimeloyl-ACP methyl ester carboxylesterase
VRKIRITGERVLRCSCDALAIRAKPTLILLHGGPGFDHMSYKPAFSALSDIAQIVYLDHRGNGRSSSAGSRPLMDLWTRQLRGRSVIAPYPLDYAVVLVEFNDEPAVALTRHH